MVARFIGLFYVKVKPGARLANKILMCRRIIGKTFLFSRKNRRALQSDLANGKLVAD